MGIERSGIRRAAAWRPQQWTAQPCKASPPPLPAKRFVWSSSSSLTPFERPASRRDGTGQSEYRIPIWLAPFYPKPDALVRTGKPVVGRSGVAAIRDIAG